VDLVAWAAEESRRRLAGIGTRWAHCRGVAARAEEIAAVVDSADRTLLVVAAYLHDVGHAPELVVSRFHPLDGARWLETEGFDRLAALVAHHTAAIFEAHERGLGDELARFVNERSPVTDALAYSDLTTGPAGQRVTAAERLAEIEARYGHESIVVRALTKASETLGGTVARTERRLAENGAALTASAR
jgi:HD superfamily phosphodiesterase